jgi:hypothetical protein
MESRRQGNLANSGFPDFLRSIPARCPLPSAISHQPSAISHQPSSCMRLKALRKKQLTMMEGALLYLISLAFLLPTHVACFGFVYNVFSDSEFFSHVSIFQLSRVAGCFDSF